MASHDSKDTPTSAKGDGVERRLARHGGLSYLEIPAVDVQRSADFYAKVCGWKVEQRDSADHRFQDPAGMLIGRWVTGRAVSREPGWLPYFYVENVAQAVERAVEQGGTIVRAVYPEGNLRVATVTDPAGNVIGLWQEADS